MNLRLFTIAVLIMAIPFHSQAGAELSLNKGDFIAAEKITQDGETVVQVKLSKSGKAKFRKLNKQTAGQSVHAEIAGVKTDFKLRVPISGDGLQMGPYTVDDAQKVVSEINND